MPVIEHVAPSPDFVTSADVVVIGAGIIGISTALELLERGLSVVVVEKGEVGAEQSSRNWGWCRQMGRDARELPLIKISLDLWRGMNARIGAETGYRTCGIVYLSETEEQLAAKVNWFEENAKPYDLPTRVITGHEATELVPGSSIHWKGGIYTAEDGRAEPFIAVPAMARAVQSLGGKIFTRCAARGIETKAGRVCSVVTERGSIATSSVVLAGGYWSERFLGNLGVVFPQLGVVNSVMRTSAVDMGHNRTFSGNRFAARKRLDGGYTVTHNHFSVAEVTPQHFRHGLDFLPLLLLDVKGVKVRIGKRLIDEWKLARRWRLDQVSPFEQVRVLDPEPYEAILDEAAVALRKAYPIFKDMRIEERWAGMIDATPDAVPVIDSIEKVPGLFMASGFSGHGFGLGPGAGKLMAEMVTGENRCIDATAFRFKRFSDGTKHRPSTGL